MTKTKITKLSRIAELERKLRETEAQLVHVYHFASATIEKADMKHLMGSGVLITMHVLGGQEVFSPIVIRDGLSDETINGLKADMVRSYENATMFKPSV